MSAVSGLPRSFIAYSRTIANTGFHPKLPHEIRMAYDTRSSGRVSTEAFATPEVLMGQRL
jgi:hypothetical protein